MLAGGLCGQDRGWERDVFSTPDRMNSSLLRASLHASTQPGFGSLSEPRGSSRPLQRPGSQWLPGLHLEGAFAAQKILAAVSPCSLFMLLGKQKGGPRGLCGDGWGEAGRIPHGHSLWYQLTSLTLRALTGLCEPQTVYKIRKDQGPLKTITSDSPAVEPTLGECRATLAAAPTLARPPALA